MDMLGGKGTNTPTALGSIFLIMGIIVALIIYFIGGQKVSVGFWVFIGVAVCGFISLLIGLNMK